MKIFGDFFTKAADAVEKTFEKVTEPFENGLKQLGDLIKKRLH